MNAQIEKYINKRYERWLDYSKFQTTQAGLTDEAVDVLNEVLHSLLKKDENYLLDLLNKGKGPYTELDFFVLRMIKMNAQSDTAPYRHKNRHLPVDRNVDYRKLEIEDKMTDQIDISGNYLNQYQEVIQIVDRFDLDMFEKDIFKHAFVCGESLMGYPSSGNQKYTLWTPIKRAVAWVLFLEGRIKKPPHPLQTHGRIYKILRSYYMSNDEKLDLLNNNILINNRLRRK